MKWRSALGVLCDCKTVEYSLSQRIFFYKTAID